MQGLLLPLILLAFCATNAAAQAIVPFGKGQATIKPPPGYTHRLDEDGETIVLVPKGGLAQVRFTYHPVPVTKEHPQLAREFVIDAARQREKQVTKLRGARSVGFIERGPPATLDGEPCRTLQGMLTLGRGYVTFVVLVPERNVQMPEMREFMKTGINQLISALEPKGKS